MRVLQYEAIECAKCRRARAEQMEETGIYTAEVSGRARVGGGKVSLWSVRGLCCDVWCCSSERVIGQGWGWGQGIAIRDWHKRFVNASMLGSSLSRSSPQHAP